VFKSATLKLTLWYVLLIMSLSFLFSGVIYHFSNNELAEGLHDQYEKIASSDHDADDISDSSNAEVETGSHRLFGELVAFNVTVLIGSSLFSYVLARRTLRPIEAAHKAQIRFTSDASHELRTPLTAIKADTEATLMNGHSGNKILRKTLLRNLEDIEKLDKLTNNLLDISRYDARSNDNSKVIDIVPIIKEIQENLNRHPHKIKVKFSISKTACQINGNPQDIQRLITIVIDNATKYSQPKGSINVGLSKGKSHITITVEDKGIGIPADDIPHIFERFYRSKNAESKETPGYGLGLPLAKNIADTYDGTISVSSKVNTGTKVTISFPIV